ncbi:alpha/beta fold hydrolase [Reinekea blandensis]|uniref:Predicted Hydrolase or acyltransferase (Alpha/beta hydrolase superfamily) protein n=1 Tax=Reinekea blandensis MED297 TaxID=314283 RepID=A4BBI3_9GAMM|nr:alpha/beta fold hydrolase [Reinekea blandensis]EAR10318.1 predicted Hydrolase or acyltransferase (alpha/beta hydrolase superfamily) protein [Reinekea sp. MED297] [Reinekea blandensis MED297]
MLHSESFGQGPDIIFLHGLFGAGDNWRSIGRALSEQFRIHLLDLPNHGRSPWTDNPDLPSLAESVADWADQQGLTRYHLLGHSMGGKVAMQMALNEYANQIDRLIIVDIAPKAYAPHHQDVFAGLHAIDFDSVKDRKAVDAQLTPYVQDAGIRQFLLKSLYKKDNRLAWRFNVDVLENKYDAVACAPEVTQPFNGPTLFIKGMNSKYIEAQDQDTIQTLFPEARAKLIEGAGHWPHAEKPAAFKQILEGFLGPN